MRNVLLGIGGAGVLSIGGLVAYNFAQRRKLVTFFQEYVGLGDKLAKEEAEKLIPLFSFKSAEKAKQEYVVKQLEAPGSAEGKSWAQESAEAAQETATSATAWAIEKGLDIYQSLPDIPGFGTGK